MIKSPDLPVAVATAFIWQLTFRVAPGRLLKAIAFLRGVEVNDVTAAKRLGGDTAVSCKLREMDDRMTRPDSFLPRLIR